ncbi:MAG: hypothetical protein H8E90_02535 [Anaerolineales bacterium]|nr:hypothetical protein [Anaerolineales bacterium]
MAEVLTREQKVELVKCSLSGEYFIDTYCWIEDKTAREWVRFQLWPAQVSTLQAITENKLFIVLKARQLGLTWLLVCYGLWMMLFRPGSGVLLFSRRDDEAAELLDRVRQCHLRLPSFLQARVGTDNDHELELVNLGSVAQAFPTTKHSGRSYTATLAVVDEADYIRWLRQLLTAVKPTIDAGGQLGLISTVDKEDPSSEFKRIWNQAVAGGNSYRPIFLPWHSRPGRDAAWYAQQQADYTEDDLFQEYPASPAEALAARKSSKRFLPAWLALCTGSASPLDCVDAPPLPGLVVWEAPRRGGGYLVVADPCEGNPTSDPSPAAVFDVGTWNQVAGLYGQFQPDIFGGYLVELSRWYNEAVICVERNNHGHAVHVAIGGLGADDLIYQCPLDEKDGWLSNAKNKVLATDVTAEVLREGGCVIQDQATINELAMFEGSSLKAPPGMTDDRAMTVIIGMAALRWPSLRNRGTGESAAITPDDIIDERETGGW